MIKNSGMRRDKMILGMILGLIVYSLTAITIIGYGDYYE